MATTTETICNLCTWCLCQLVGCWVPSSAVLLSFREQHWLWQLWQGECKLPCTEGAGGRRDQLEGHWDALNQCWHPGSLSSFWVKPGSFFSTESVGLKQEGRAWVGLQLQQAGLKLQRQVVNKDAFCFAAWFLITELLEGAGRHQGDSSWKGWWIMPGQRGTSLHCIPPH